MLDGFYKNIKSDVAQTKCWSPMIQLTLLCQSGRFNGVRAGKCLSTQEAANTPRQVRFPPHHPPCFMLSLISCPLET